MIYHKLKKILPQINSPVIVEIGAHIGTDTKKIASLLREPYLYFAIEPDVRNFKQLAPICKYINAKLIPVAIGDKDDTLPFWYSSGKNSSREHTDSGSLKRPINTPKRPAFVTFNLGNVPCFKLDWLFSVYSLRHIDLIWMDVQGAELEVFAGAEETLRHTSYIYTECQEGRYVGQPGIDGILEALPGWNVVLKNGDNVLLENKQERYCYE